MYLVLKIQRILQNSGLSEHFKVAQFDYKSNYAILKCSDAPLFYLFLLKVMSRDLGE